MPEKENSESLPTATQPRKFLGIELTFRPSKVSKQQKPLIETGVTPVANFLPPRVRDSKIANFVRRRLLAASIATMAVSFLAYLGATVISFSGTVILQNAELRLASVKAEQAKYNPVRELENSIRFQEAARYVATATQIDVSDLVKSLTQQLPNGASYTSIQVTPFSPEDLNTSGLTKEFSVKALISMELKDYPSLQSYLNRLPGLEAFYDYRLASVSATETGISVSLVLYLSTDLYSRLYEEALVLGDPIPISILDTEPRIPEVTEDSLAEQTNSNTTPTPVPTPRPSSSPTPTPSPTEEVTG